MHSVKEARGDLPGGVLARYRRLLHPLADINQIVEGLFGRLFSPNNLDQFHLRNGVKEVQSAELLLPLLRGSVGDLGDREGRSVGGEDGVFRCQTVEFREKLLFDLDVFDDGLDDQVSGLDRFGRFRRRGDVGKGLLDQGFLRGLVLWVSLLGYPRQGF